MKVVGIIGWPIAHTRSPTMHQAALRDAGIDAQYVVFPVDPDALPAAISGMRALGIAGLNVTIPHKIAVMSELDALEPLARRAAAVNTIYRDDDNRLVGANTDAEGLVQSLREAAVVLNGAHVVIVGAGGAARAAALGLSDAGAASISIAARRPERAEELLRQTGIDGEARGLDMLELESATLLIQATGAMMSPASAQALCAKLPLNRLPSTAVVVDLVYTPKETALLAAARARGLKVVDGTGMLIHQGALAFEKWFRRKPSIEAMRAALLSSLGEVRTG